MLPRLRQRQFNERSTVLSPTQSRRPPLGLHQRDVAVRRAGLIEKGLIFNPVATTLDFTVPQFAAYLRRTHAFDPAARPSRGQPRKRR
jgi:hypothetical protein